MVNIESRNPRYTSQSQTYKIEDEKLDIAAFESNPI